MIFLIRRGRRHWETTLLPKLAAKTPPNSAFNKAAAMSSHSNHPQHEEPQGSVRGAPHLKVDVIPMWWSHICPLQANNLVLYQWQEARYTDPFQRPVGTSCPAGWSVKTFPMSLLESLLTCMIQWILYHYHNHPLQPPPSANRDHFGYQPSTRSSYRYSYVVLSLLALGGE